MNKETCEKTHFIPCNPVARGESWLRRRFLENEELYKTGVWGEFPKVRLYNHIGEEVKERIELMYESPITVLTRDMTMNVDGEITKLVQNFDVHVNQEEIIRALKYDREQYEKGYTEGSKDFAYRLKHLLENTDISIDGPIDCILRQIEDYHAPLEDDKDLKRAFELLKAEKEGRLLEMPCKVGDEVYTIMKSGTKVQITSGIITCFKDEKGVEKTWEVEALCLDEHGAFSGIANVLIHENDIGYLWHLSREDAEKALEALHQPQTKLTPTESTTESTTEKGGVKE